MGKVDTKHKRFVAAYIRFNFNGVKAYRHVYGKDMNYDSARVGSSNLLQKPNIREAVNKALEAEHLSTEEALQILASHAKADIGQYIDSDGNVDLEQMKADGLSHLIKEIEMSETMGEKSSSSRRRIKFHDPQNAINMILRVQGKFKDNLNLGDKVIRVTIGKAPDNDEEE